MFSQFVYMSVLQLNYTNTELICIFIEEAEILLPSSYGAPQFWAAGNRQKIALFPLLNILHNVL